MTAFNIVRMRVKPGRQREFENSPSLEPQPAGARRANLVKTGDTSYCFIGEWNSYKDIVAARSLMIADLDRFREILADLGGGLGVTYPVSGEAVVDIDSGSGRRLGPSSVRPAFNIARYRVKPGSEQDFVVSVRQAVTDSRGTAHGFKRAALVDIGTRAFVFLGEWESLASLTRTGPSMIASIDSKRELLEELGGSVGSTHVVSGEVVVAYGGAGGETS